MPRIIPSIAPRALIALGLSASLAACGDDGPTEPRPVIETIIVESGDQQVGPPEGTLAAPVVARALLDDGSAYTGVVQVTVVTGAGSIAAGTSVATGNGGSLGPSSPTGLVSILWTLGEPEGQQRLRFWVPRGQGDTVSAFATASAELAAAGPRSRFATLRWMIERIE